MGYSINLLTSSNSHMDYHLSIDIGRPDDYRTLPIELAAVDPHTPGEPLQAQFLGDGVIRLFRQSSSQSELTNSGDDTMVLILAVPSYFTATDLLGFIGDSYLPHITHLRILKSDKPNRFVVLIKFDDIVKAAEFHYNYNGKPFNSMEPESCMVVFIKSVRFQEGSTNDMLIPFMLDDPFTRQNHQLVELPTCPVCLDRMDLTVTGLITIPCQHTFHCQCLSKWSDDTCPICRYSNVQGKRRPRRRSLLRPVAEVGDEHCADCSVNTSLWVCLICGNIGCDRYAPDQHSLKHFVETGHCFAMELDTSRVWDYAGDNYVHRLVTNSDGKIVEISDKHEKSTSEKVDAVGLEYLQLLISQLASQREYYEDLMAQMAPKSRRDSTLTKLGDYEKKLDLLSQEMDQMKSDFKDKLRAKDLRIVALTKELQSVNSMHDGLSNKIEHVTQENELLKAQNAELQDQVKDLIFFLESQERFKDDPEAREGTVVVKDKKKKRR